MRSTNPEPISSTTNRRYDVEEFEPTRLTIEYKDYLDRFVTEFGDNYQIWVREDNLNKLAVGIVNPNLNQPIAVTIWLKYGNSHLKYNPLDSNLIDAVRNHLKTSKEDLHINHPLEN